MSEIRSDKSRGERPEVSACLVTSLDGQYVIPDCLKQSFAVVKNQLLISAPWTSARANQIHKSFILSSMIESTSFAGMVPW